MNFFDRIEEKHIRWVGVPIIGLFVAYWKHSPVQNEDILMSVIACFIQWNVAVYILMYFRRKFPSVKQTLKRLITTIITVAVSILLVDLLMKPFFAWLGLCDPLTLHNIFEFWPISFVLAIIVGSFYETVYYFGLYKEKLVETEQLKTQQIINQLEVLKNQISPHFLFNSLNTLINLIEEKPESAVHFTEKLSDFYRYILQHKDHELIPLKEELRFIRAYIYLLKMRFTENLNITFEVDEKFEDYQIAPLTLQMLLENAIKHNIISKAKPLFVEIFVNDELSVVVRNNLQKKSLVVSTRTGLENIKKRYQFLSKKSVEILDSATNFAVAVPLLDINQN